MLSVTQRVWRGFKWAAERTGLARLHRDEEGALLEYLLVMAAIVIPIMALFDKLFEVLSEYFGMIAFYVSWPFL